jgi:hypothetical protein
MSGGRALSPEEKKRVEEIRNAWRYESNISTLPSWERLQRGMVQLAERGLPDADFKTRAWIVRELLLTLRCYQCERRLNDECHFNICIRGLLSGVGGGMA